MKTFGSTLLILIIQSLFAVVQSQAQSVTWEKMQKESEGGLVEDILVMNGKIFMSRYFELYQSTDNGNTWTYVLSTKALAAGYGSANSSYASDKKFIVSGDSIFFGNQFSPDGGTTWQTWSIDPSTLPTWYYSPTVLNIQGSNLYLGTYYNGLYQSTDFGKKWVAKNNGYPAYYWYESASVIEFYKGEPVIATASGIYRWSGTTWINCTGTGLPTTNINGYNGYLVDRLRFLGSMWLASTNYGVYYSNNMGTTWQRFDPIAQITGLKPWTYYSTPAVFYNLDVSGGIIFACYESDIYISTDAGANWKHSQLPDKVQSKRIVVSSNEFLIATSSGIYKSNDGGNSWHKSNKGFERVSYSILPANGEGFLVSFGNGILKSSNYGKTLTPFNTGLSLNHVNIRAIGSNEMFSHVYRYYSYGGVGQSAEYEFYRSSTATPQWTKLTDFPWSQIYTMEISPKGDYLVTGATPGISPSSGLHLSEDKGQSWSNIFKGVTHNTLKEDFVVSAMFDGDTLYAGAEFSGIYKSWDKGVTWTSFSTGLTLPTDKNSLGDPNVTWYINKFRKHNNHIYAIGIGWDPGTGNEVSQTYHSSDWGKHWSKIDYSSLSPVVTGAGLIDLELTSEGLLVANIYTDYTYLNSKLIISYDHGATWKYLTPDFPEALVTSFGVLGDYLYISGYKGLYRIPAPAMATMKIIAASVKGNKNDEMIVPIKVNGFQDVLSGQFTVTWDASVATFVGVEDFGVSGLQESNFGVTQTGNGILTFSWDEPNLIPQNLPDSSTWFSVRFKLNGFYRDKSSIKIVNTPLAIEVIDKDFNEVTVKTYDGQITINNLQLIGKVEYGNKQPLPGATLTLTGSDNQITTSTSDGSFEFGVSPQSLNDKFTISPSVSGVDPLDGIDVADIAMLRRHLLQTEILTNQYSLIAGDVNGSKSLSTLDILLIEALVLGKIDTWPGNATWTFVPADFVFDQTPFSHPEEIKIDLNNEQAGQYDFIGVKYGDVNLSYLSSSSGGRTSSGQEVVFDIHEETVVSENDNSKIITIGVRTQNFQDVSAFQLGLNWPKEKLDLIEVQGINADVKSGKNAENDQVTIIWDSPVGKWTSLNDNTSLFQLKFISTNNGGYKDLTVLESTGLVVYDKAIQSVRADVKWTEEPENRMVNVYPNPFTDKLFVRFYADVQEECNVRFLDVAGRTVSSTIMQANEGQNTFILNSAEFMPGLYIVEIKHGLMTTRQKVVHR